MRTSTARTLSRARSISATDAAPSIESEPSDEALNLFGDERDEVFAQSMGMVIAELRAEWRQEIKRLERENIELRGKVDTLTTILAGGRTKSAEDGRRILYHPRFVEGFRTALAEARAELCCS